MIISSGGSLKCNKCYVIFVIKYLLREVVHFMEALGFDHGKSVIFHILLEH